MAAKTAVIPTMEDDQC